LDEERRLALTTTLRRRFLRRSRGTNVSSSTSAFSDHAPPMIDYDFRL
jgi:hypothetical protein